MSAKMIFSRFVRSYKTLDFRTTTEQQMIADRRKQAQRYETLKHTNGKRSEFNV